MPSVSSFLLLRVTPASDHRRSPASSTFPATNALHLHASMTQGSVCRSSGLHARHAHGDYVPVLVREMLQISLHCSPHVDTLPSDHPLTSTCTSRSRSEFIISKLALQHLLFRGTATCQTKQILARSAVLVCQLRTSRTIWGGPGSQ